MVIPEAAGEQLRVAVVAHSERQRRYLAEVLEPHGVQVVADEVLRARLPDRVDEQVADVLLVDLQEEGDGDLDLDALIDQTELPMLFNDGDASKRHAPKSIAGTAWGRRLAGKLAALVKDQPATQPSAPALKLVVEEPVQEAAAPSVREPDLGAALGFELDGELEFETGLLTSDSETPTADASTDDPSRSASSSAGEAPTAADPAFDFPSLELPDLEDSEATDLGMQAFEAPAQTPEWSLDPAPDADAPALSNTMEFDTVPTLSDDIGLGEFDTSESVADANAWQGADALTLSEDFDLGDALLSEVSETPASSTADELPALTDAVAWPDTLRVDDPAAIVAAELSADELDDDLALSLQLQDLETEFAAAPARSEPGPEAAQMPVWVLGASIGGPQAVKEFVARLPADTPAAFVVAQHIGSGFVELLASQLDRVTPLEVRAAESGMTLCPGRIVVAPVEQRLTFADGVISLQPNRRKSVYSPSIDDVMTEVAAAFGGRANAVVFSGMGSDGVEGARAIAAAGGTIWGQESSTCVISSMADSARAAGVVSESGSPAQLAQRLLETLNRETSHA